MRHNLVLDTDSYKFGHFRQYPEKTESMFGYLESRGGRYGATLFFGLQGLLKEYFSNPVTASDVAEAAEFAKAHGVPFPLDGWNHIVNQHGGYLPVMIRAVPEGTLVPVRNVLLTAESTDPVVPWIVGWIETKLMRLWYPITVATRSYYAKLVINEYLEKTAESAAYEIPFKLHDFGSRGVSSRESAAIGGAAHLVNFLGTDTIEGALYAKEYYGLDAPVAGYSIPAMEHSTVTSWGKTGEAAAYKNMLDQNGGYPLLACVSDSYDIYKAVENLWADQLLDQVKASGQTIVIRPDSGDPVEVNLKLLGILERKVGMSLNSKGYKVLPKYFRLIQGDGNDTEDDIWRVLQAMEEKGYSASNIAFGMGGGLLQKLDRDTQRFAYKLSEIVVDGEVRDVSKNPITDPTKKSKAGKLDLQKHNWNEFVTVPRQPNYRNSELTTFYENGRLVHTESFDQIRVRAGKAFK